MRLLMRRLVRLLFRRKRSDWRDLAMIVIFCVVTSAYGLVLGHFGGPLAFRIGLAVPFVFLIAMLALDVRLRLRRIERAKRNQSRPQA
ncbi:MAG: hypothetical protein WBC44_16145 [Planctomycetaceae bacterium]